MRNNSPTPENRVVYEITLKNVVEPNSKKKRAQGALERSVEIPRASLDDDRLYACSQIKRNRVCCTIYGVFLECIDDCNVSGQYVS